MEENDSFKNVSHSRDILLSFMQISSKFLFIIQISLKNAYIICKPILIRAGYILLKRLKKDNSKASPIINSIHTGKYIKKLALLDYDEPDRNVEDATTVFTNEDVATPVQISDINEKREQDDIPIRKTADKNLVPQPIEFNVCRGPYYFCTMVGKEYLLKALALHQSLQKLAGNFKLWICCIDDVSYSILSRMNLYNVYAFTLDKIEDNELLSIKSYRKTNEYCWTLKAPLIRYVLHNYNVADVIYCDTDLYFFSDPKPIYEEWGNCDVFLCPQRDIQWVESKYGKYQAGLVGFKNTTASIECLSFWRNKCIEWCFSNPEPEMERFGDQKYLDKLPLLFQGVKIIENLGVDAAPWNCIYNNNYNIYEKDSNIHIEKDKLVVFHFATINIYNDSEFDLWAFNYIPISKIIMNKIYLPYLTAIRECIDKVKSVDAGSLNLLYSQKTSSEAKTYYKYPPLKFMINTEDDTKYFCTIMSSEYLIRGLAFYSSLRVHARKFHLWVCCVDEASHFILNGMKLKDVTLIPLADLEDDKITAVKKGRKTNEFCWTLKAPMVHYILTNYDIDYILYCDADIFFFADPTPVFENLRGHSIYICRQRDTYEFEKVHGSFQAGFIGFKNDTESLKVLAWWQQKCIEWCSDEPQPQFERWGDQKYLDKLPMQFSGIKLENNFGINAAPWNTVFNNNFKVHKLDGKVYVENDILIFYHFGSMLFYNENEYDLWKLKPLTFDSSIIKNIYIPYLNVVKDLIKKIRPYINGHLKKIFSDKDVMLPVNYFNTIEYKE